MNRQTRMQPWLMVALVATFAATAHANPFDYRDPTNPDRAVRMWLPHGVPRINGIIVWGNPGTGDSRANVFNPALRAWASNIGFGLLCTKALSFDTAPVVLEALQAFAASTSHVELRDVPFVALGHSNGGLVALGLAKSAPARTIAFAMNKAAVFVEDMPPAAYGVPAIFVAGEFDLERRKTPMKALFAHHRAQGALWAFVQEQSTGHGGKESRAMDLIMPFLQAAITQRLAAGSPILRPLDEKQGWLAQVGPSRGTPLPVARFDRYRGTARTAAWLLDEATARLFSAVVTYDRPLRLTVGAGVREDNAELVAPGRAVDITLETFAADEHWQRFVWFDGADVLGETTAPAIVSHANAAAQGAPSRWKASLRPGVHGLWAQGHRKDGAIFVSAPARVVVSGGSGNPFDSAARAPRILAQPADQMITEGDVASFDVRATGGGDLRYQWLRNNKPIDGATHPSLHLPNQDLVGGGDVFTAHVANESGATTSLPARLSVAPFAGADATYTSVAPVIDGRVEKAWLAAPAHPLANVIAGSREGVSTTARWRALWDHQALYVLIEGNDDERYGSARDAWSNDTAEVFLEGPNSKGARWGPYGYQFGLPFGSDDLFEAFTGKVPADVRSQRGEVVSNPSSHAVEYRFGETSLGVSFVEDLRLGFEVQVNDCGRSGLRRVKLAWHCRENNAYEGPHHLGILRLVKAPRRRATLPKAAMVPIQR